MTKTELHKKMGKNITQLRTDRNLTRAELAYKLKITESMLSRLETGKRALTAHMVYRVAEFFEVGEGELFR